MNTLLVAKQSKYEYEKQKFGLTHDQIVIKYNKERANLAAILLSHEKQLRVREQFRNIMPDSIMCLMNEAPNFLNNQNYHGDQFDLVIVIGGDNAFTFVSHHVKDIPILGVNSDPERSAGCLTRWAIHDIQSIHDLVEMLDFNEFDIHKWTRLEATIDGNPITPASNEYFFGERQSNKMSRHVLVYKDVEQEQKSSGIIVTTGSGSTGWYSSIRGKEAAFDPTWDIGAFVVREPYDPSDDGSYAGELGPDDELIIYSLNDDEGFVSVDSWEEEPFTRGSEARISIGRPLNVVMPKETK